MSSTTIDIIQALGTSFIQQPDLMLSRIYMQIYKNENKVDPVFGKPLPTDRSQVIMIFKKFLTDLKKEDDKKKSKPQKISKQCGFKTVIQKGHGKPQSGKPSNKKGKDLPLPFRSKGKGKQLKHIPITFQNPLKKYNQLLLENMVNIILFKNQLSKILRENQYSRPIDGFNSGVSINTHKLYKFASKNYSFFQKRQAKVKSYQFFILADVSGSMDWCINPLKSTIVVLTEGFKKTLSEFGAGVFNDHYKRLKPMSKIIDSKFLDNIDGLRATGGTNDHFAILESLKEFKAGDKKILIVITDGGGNNPPITRMLLEKQKDVTVIGVGLNGVNVSQTYPNFINCNIDQLAPVLIKTLRRYV